MNSNKQQAPSNKQQAPSQPAPSNSNPPSLKLRRAGQNKKQENTPYAPLKWGFSPIDD